MENLVINKELKRVILFSNEMDKSRRGMQDFLTAFNANRFKTVIFKYEDVINESYEVYENKYDLIKINRSDFAKRWWFSIGEGHIKRANFKREATA